MFRLLLLILAAHPIDKNTYDRTLDVILFADRLEVAYALEIDSGTIYRDVPNLVSAEAFSGLSRAEQIYTAFLHAMAPRLGRLLDAKLDGKGLVFSCWEKRYQVTDHVRFDYRFQAKWTLSPDALHRLTFRESNYDDELGHIRLSLRADRSLGLVSSMAPDEKLKTKPYSSLLAGEYERLLTANATFRLAGRSGVSEPLGNSTPTNPSSSPDPLFPPQFGVWLLLGLAAVFGAWRGFARRRTRDRRVPAGRSP